MTEQSLTVQQVLRYANHDFLNDLHLIKMNLDLGRIEEAKELIDKIATQCTSLSKLSKIGLPKTVEYLQTLKWRYPEFQMNLSSNITKTLNEQKDELIVQYLEETILHVYSRLDAFSEQHLQIDIAGAEDEFAITVHFVGQFNEALDFNHELNAFHIETLEQTTTSWKFVMRNRE